MKKTVTLMIIMIFLLSLSASSAFAGSKQRYRWQGVAMGVGAAILGNALINNSRNDSYRDQSYRGSSCPERVVVVDRSAYDRSCEPAYGRGHHRDQGRWEIRKIWVAPVCESVWNPGHYNRHNHWVSGRYITIETAPGYWQEERVWVACR